MNIDKILDLIDQSHINKSVLLQHDQARETFTLPKMIVGDHEEFKYLPTRRRILPW